MEHYTAFTAEQAARGAAGRRPASVERVLRTGAPWRGLPQYYGPYTTCYNRLNRWRKAKGVWERLMDAIVAAYDGNVQMTGSLSVRVH